MTAQRDERRPSRAGRTGVWLVGARGSVATTAMVGAAAVVRGLVPPTGCVTETSPFDGLGLPPLDRLVFGGHDVVDTPLATRAASLERARVIPPGLLAAVGDALEAAERSIRPGYRPGVAATQRAGITTLMADLAEFRLREGLDQVVVVNVASTEPAAAPHPAHASLGELDRALAAGETVLPPSAAYAYASLASECAFVDFTPSTGARLPALHELARMRRAPYGGSDGKTGETLLKSVLAPMFRSRALAVRSWSGTNLLGGGDGANLADPEAAATKLASKRRSLEEALGGSVVGATHIDYVPDLGEWKTAWDHVTFEGFLGVGMTFQFTWQGCDSTLAAPLVLDLVRLAALAHDAGQVGPLEALAFFFKDPIGVGPFGSLAAQHDRLVAWASSLVAPEPAADDDPPGPARASLPRPVSVAIASPSGNRVVPGR